MKQHVKIILDTELNSRQVMDKLERLIDKHWPEVVLTETHVIREDLLKKEAQ